MSPSALELVEARASEKAEKAKVAAALAAKAGKRTPKDITTERLAAKVRPTKQVDDAHGASANSVVAAAVFGSIATFAAVVATGMRRRNSAATGLEPLLSSA